MGAGTTNGFANNATNYQGQSWDVAAGTSGKWDGLAYESGGDNASISKMNPLDRVTLFTNWMTGGGMPKTIDPSVAISQAQKTAGVTRQGAQGMGIGGLFGLGNMNMFAPMQSGVPYSAAPIASPGSAPGSGMSGPGNPFGGK